MLKYRRIYLDAAPLKSPRKGDAGYDIPVYTPLVIEPNTIRTVDTGVAVQIPEGFLGLVVGRSGNAFVKDIYVIHVGTIDSSFRGELKVRIINLGSDPIGYTTGDYVAQLLVIPVYNSDAVEVSSLDDSLRGSEGFGSTGIPGTTTHSLQYEERVRDYAKEVAQLW